MPNHVSGQRAHQELALELELKVDVVGIAHASRIRKSGEGLTDNPRSDGAARRNRPPAVHEGFRQDAEGRCAAGPAESPYAHRHPRTTTNSVRDCALALL
ncbi:hypothetical protein HMPREF0972_00577 [Actinomyces sp. oral taxon 848 str. F0332]|nr:hypothetical protein HMPREF0972_00577 [Actinomyces sp. oral taxon 848 str. F0332]